MRVGCASVVLSHVSAVLLMRECRNVWLILCAAPATVPSETNGSRAPGEERNNGSDGETEVGSRGSGSALAARMGSGPASPVSALRKDSGGIVIHAGVVPDGLDAEGGDTDRGGSGAKVARKGGKAKAKPGGGIREELRALSDDRPTSGGEEEGDDTQALFNMLLQLQQNEEATVEGIEAIVAQWPPGIPLPKPLQKLYDQHTAAAQKRMGGPPEGERDGRRMGQGRVNVAPPTGKFTLTELASPQAAGSPGSAPRAVSSPGSTRRAQAGTRNAKGRRPGDTPLQVRYLVLGPYGFWNGERL